MQCTRIRTNNYPLPPLFWRLMCGKQGCAAITPIRDDIPPHQGYLISLPDASTCNCRNRRIKWIRDMASALKIVHASLGSIKETLNKCYMSRVADQITMIARRVTQVAAATRYRVAADCGSRRQQALSADGLRRTVSGLRAGTTMPRSATPRVRNLVATRTGTDFAGGLLRCTRYEGDQPFAASCALHPIPQNRVRDHAGLTQCFPMEQGGDGFPQNVS